MTRHVSNEGKPVILPKIVGRRKRKAWREKKEIDVTVRSLDIGLRIVSRNKKTRLMEP